jgi:hypothetical protein
MSFPKLKLPTNSVLPSAVLFALALTGTTASAQEFSDVQSNGNFHLRGYGSFFIPGDLATCPTPPSPATNSNMCSGTTNPGLHMINQMYVAFMLPQAQNGKKHNPIGIIHGCCLSTKSWQTTPDGRMGWDEYFVRQGFSTFMMDQVGRARSGFDPVAYNSVRLGLTPCVPTATVACPQNPNVLIASDQFAWNIFRWGTTPCTTSPCSVSTTPHADIKFPMQTVGVGLGSNTQFFNMVIPDMTATLSGAPSPADPAGFYNSPSQMAKLASKVGGMIFMGHSQSSSFPIRLSPLDIGISVQSQGHHPTRDRVFCESDRRADRHPQAHPHPRRGRRLFHKRAPTGVLCDDDGSDK